MGAELIVPQQPLTPDDIPATLGNTAFPTGGFDATGLYAAELRPTSTSILVRGSNANFATIAGGASAAQSDGASFTPHGNTHATKAGIAEYYTGAASGASHTFYDKNADDQVIIDERGLLLPSGGTVYADYLAAFTSSIIYLTASSTFVIPSPPVPASASATGAAGQIAWDSGFIYICTATDTWKRVVIATW